MSQLENINTNQDKEERYEELYQRLKKINKVSKRIFLLFAIVTGLAYLFRKDLVENICACDEWPETNELQVSAKKMDYFQKKIA